MKLNFKTHAIFQDIKFLTLSTLMILALAFVALLYVIFVVAPLHLFLIPIIPVSPYNPNIHSDFVLIISTFLPLIMLGIVLLLGERYVELTK